MDSVSDSLLGYLKERKREREREGEGMRRGEGERGRVGGNVHDVVLVPYPAVRLSAVAVCLIRSYHQITRLQ